MKYPKNIDDYKPVLLQELVERYLTTQAMNHAGNINDGTKVFLVSEVLNSDNVSNFTFNQITKAIDQFVNSLQRLMLSYITNINNRIKHIINPANYDNSIFLDAEHEFIDEINKR